MGGAFVIDIIVIFIWRALGRLFKLIRTAKWQHAQANIIKVCSPSTLGPGPLITVYYRFDVNQKAFSGVSKVPFLINSSAMQYAKALSKVDIVIVRFDPRAPEDSVFFTTDQEGYVGSPENL